MADFLDLPHLKIDKFFNPKEYIYPKDVVIDFPLMKRNRAVHGRNLINQLNAIKEKLKLNKEEVLPNNIVRDDVVYVEFYSEWNFPLKFESLNQENENPKYQILNIQKEEVLQNEQLKERYKVVVMLKEGAVSTFLSKVAKYLTENRKDKERKDTGFPKNEALINNIQSIELATLKSFWTDAPEIPFPDSESVIWWEVWFRKTNNDENRLNNVLQNLSSIGAAISEQSLTFPEHIVKLVKGSAIQLSSSLLLLDNLAELRNPQEINDFITSSSVTYDEKQNWLNDLQARIENHTNENSVVICLLDTGVNNKHPLLANFLPDECLYTYRESWGTEDTWGNSGHGTGMGGLALYGDLTEVLASPGQIKIYHRLESVKVIHPNDSIEPKLYGSLFQYTLSLPVIANPDNSRVYCLSVTDGSLSFHGRPSSASAALDKIAYGNPDEKNSAQLIIASGGNVNYFLPNLSPLNFPSENLATSVHDPSQGYNLLTIGSYTRMDRVDQNVWEGFVPLAPNGGIAPSNSTSLMWDSQWPNKPDLVFEGGNLAVNGSQIHDDVHTLKPLSLDKDFANYIFWPLGDTSGATALVSRMAAQLKTEYPQYWPETIRALLVHSADWTDTMLNGIALENASNNLKRELLRTFGYGVPNLERALFSAKNMLTLIAENILKPYQLHAGSTKYREYHLYEIPWPSDILLNDLGAIDVKLKVTLSYFIEPNPGDKRYANNFHYHSHNLDFKVIKPTEDIETFKRRISGFLGNNDVEYEGQNEIWSLKEAVRSKGSIKKDFIVSSGADLATRNYLAIYPKSGWYKTRKKLGMVNTSVRYSLIISIETAATNIDIYAPVSVKILNSIPV